MTAEESILLRMDILPRLLCGLKVNIYPYSDDKPRYITGWNALFGDEFELSQLAGLVNIQYIKPYLRSLSNMTEAEQEELWNKYCYTISGNEIKLSHHSEGYWDDDTVTNSKDYISLIDWMNCHFFDYRGLIGKGLALEAPPNMYNIKGVNYL